MPKAYAYLRVSSQGQIDRDGYDRQRQAILQYCKAHGFEIVDWYKEQETGTIQDRPELARLMIDTEVNGNGIEAVIIERLDRLARDLMVQEAIIQDFKKQGIDLVSTAEGPDLASDDPTRKLIRQVLGAVAEYDKTMLVLKLRAARQRKKLRTGNKCEGAKRFGEESEDEQAIIRRIRAYRRNKRGNRKGLTYQQIADRLNDDGIPTKRGKEWKAMQVYRILNPSKT